MKRAGRPRRDVLARLCPRNELPIIDVGADHGHVAHAIGAIATERLPGRRGRADVSWVIADGLLPFREVGTAVIAGMGANTISEILTRGPTPRVAVLHAQDDPPKLRRWLAENGWRITQEALAPEARRFAEVIVARPGVEPCSGPQLELGPRLYADNNDPHLDAHLEQLSGYWSSIAERTRLAAPEVCANATSRVAWIETWRGKHNG